MKGIKTGLKSHGIVRYLNLALNELHCSNRAHEKHSRDAQGVNCYPPDRKNRINGRLIHVRCHLDQSSLEWVYKRTVTFSCQF